MDIRGKTILVTGANRGLGRQFTQAPATRAPSPSRACTPCAWM